MQENYEMNSFIICILHVVFLRRSITNITSVEPARSMGAGEQITSYNILVIKLQGKKVSWET
jgi:hypothetical protein